MCEHGGESEICETNTYFARIGESKATACWVRATGESESYYGPTPGDSGIPIGGLDDEG